MLNAIIRFDGETFPHCPWLRGYAIIYREGETNFCPACGRSSWYVGRLLAECAWCGAAVPLADAHLQGAGCHSRNRKQFVPSDLAA
jgi:hypothetical protein